MWKPSWFLFRQHPGAGKTCLFQMAPDSRDPFLVSASVKFSCIFTVNGSKGARGWCVGKKNHDDKSCWRTFSSKSRQLSSACYARHVWLPVLFSTAAPWRGGAGACAVPNALMRRPPLRGSHYGEHLWTVAFNWATANVYCVWKRRGLMVVWLSLDGFLLSFPFFLWRFVRSYRKQSKSQDQTPKPARSLRICKQSRLGVVLTHVLGMYNIKCGGRWKAVNLWGSVSGHPFSRNLLYFPSGINFALSYSNILNWNLAKEIKAHKGIKTQGSEFFFFWDKKVNDP